jgi:3',5'-cyclic AMP phosphodiesterase CpdA
MFKARVRRSILISLLALSLGSASLCTAQAQVTIAQISDTHLGERRAPHAADNLRKTVEMVNARHPDAVILSGDIGESPRDWQQAKQILKGLKIPLYYAPGNHDVHAGDVEQYRAEFGKDYYRFQVKNVNFIMIDSQLLGNYDHYDAGQPPPLLPATILESDKMFHWLEAQVNESARPHAITIGVQHIPDFRDHGFPNDPKPYWVVNDPYRSREMDMLHRLGIKHMLVGHWHYGRVFAADGITWHVAPATSWLPWGGELGFAMHTISPDGKVSTEFVSLEATP